MKGVDVSFHNDFVNWQTLKNAGIDFSICRTGYGKNGFDDFKCYMWQFTNMTVEKLIKYL